MKTVAQYIFDDGDWSFAEGSEEPWAEVSIDSDEGRRMISHYHEIRPALYILKAELLFDAFNQIVAHLNRNFNAWAPKYSILIAQNGEGWLTANEGPWDTLDQAKEFALAEVSGCWAILRGEQPVLIGSDWG